MSGQRLSNFPSDLHLLSSQEFTRKLTLWFEDQGIVSDLLAHLRAQLIGILRGTSFVAKPSKRCASSPKFHALHLLIAEFLLQQGHHYTLSVFASEVPLPGFAADASFGNVTRGEAKSNEEGPPRFQRKDIWDIVETLGFSPDTEESTQLYGMYQDNQGEALLTCIFRILPALSQNRLEKSKSKITVKDVNELRPTVNQTDMPSAETLEQTYNLNNTKQNEDKTPDSAFEDIMHILNESNLKNDKKAVLHKRINQLVKLEATKAQREAEQKYDRNLIDRERIIQANLIERDNLLKHCLSQSEERITIEKQEMEKGKQEMAVVAAQLRRSHEHITRSFHELEERQEMLRMREVEMERLRKLETARFIDQTNELDMQKQKLDRQLKRLEEEQAEIQSLHNQIYELRRNLDNANHALIESQSQVAFINDLQHQCSHLRRELHSSKQYLKQLSSKASHKATPAVSPSVTRSQQTEQPYDNGPGQSQTSDLIASGMLQHLQHENAELRMHLHQQDDRIQELTARAIRLAMEVEEAQTSLAHVAEQSGTPLEGSFMATESGTILPTVVPVQDPSPPPPPPPPLPPRTPVPTYLGGGEEFLVQAPPPVQTPTPVEMRETRRKPPRRLVIHNPSSSDESSPTDEVLLEARRRLRTLEEESAEVDMRFRDFKRRQALFFESTSSILGPTVQPGPSQSDRGSDHVDQHRRRSHIPSMNPTYYGASNSGLSHSRNFDIQERILASHLFPRSSGNDISPPLGYTSVNSAIPYFGRMIDIFRSSPSSDSDSPYLFSHQMHSNERLSSAVTRQTQTIPHSSKNVPTTLNYINHAFRRERDIHYNSSPSSIPKQLHKKVHFSQEPSVVIPSAQPRPQQKPSSPSVSPSRYIAPLAESISIEVDNNVNEHDNPVTSYTSIESNALERKELEQALLNDKKFVDLSGSHDSTQNKEHDSTQSDSFHPAAHSSMLETSSGDLVEHAQSLEKITSPTQGKLELKPKKPVNDSVRTENDSIEVVNGSKSHRINHSRPQSPPQQNIAKDYMNNTNESLASKQENITKDIEITNLENPIEVDANATLAVEETIGNLTKDSPIIQSGSGSGFTSSVGRLSISSVMLSSDTQESSVQETQHSAVNAQPSESESNKPLQSSPHTIVKPIKVIKHQESDVNTQLSESESNKSLQISPQTTVEPIKVIKQQESDVNTTSPQTVVEPIKVTKHQESDVSTQLSESESNKPLQTSPQTIVEPMKVTTAPLLASDEEKSIKTPSDGNMSVPENSNDDDFWA